MIRKSIRLSALLLSASIAKAAASGTASISAIGNIGLNLTSGMGVREFKKGDKNPQNPEETLTELTAEVGNATSMALQEFTSANIVPCGSIGSKFSYDFGVAKSEMIGAEVGLSWFGKKLGATIDFSNFSEILKSFPKKAKFSLSNMGIGIDAGLRAYVWRFEYGALFCTFGGEFHLNIIRTFDFEPDLAFKEKNQDKIKQLKKDMEEKIMSGVDAAIKLGVGLSLLNNKFDVRLNVRIWMVEVINKNVDGLKERLSIVVMDCFDMKHSLDLSLSIGYNFFL